MSNQNGERLVVRLYNGATCCMAVDATNIPMDVLEAWYEEMLERGYRPEMKRIPRGRSIMPRDDGVKV